MEEKLDFPVEFKKCPICGHGGKTIAQLVSEELKEKGKIPQNAFVSLEQRTTALQNPQLVLAVPLLIHHHDICAKCGMEYCTRVEKATGIPKFRTEGQIPKSPS